MSYFAKKIKLILPPFIFTVLKNIYVGIRFCCRYYFFIQDYLKFKEISETDNRFSLKWKSRYPRLDDKTNQTNFNRHYVYHTAWAARVVEKIKPEFHTDISSSLYFSSIVSAFVPVKFYDYRPANLNLNNYSGEKADLLSLPFNDESLKSLSCMHTVEHVGLGRYGDSLDAQGDLKAIKELIRVLARGGSLLFVAPIGKPKILYNAHRVYSYAMIREYFSDLHLKEFALIPENEKDGGLVYNPSQDLINKQKADGCGCFWFIKE